jgi:hypothetical protein
MQGDNNRKTIIKKPHYVGSSVVITIDPNIVKKIGIDDATFFSQELVDGNIMLKVQKLT